MAKLGDVICLPFGEQWVTGKIVYLSTISKDVFGFVVLPGVFETAEAIEVRDGVAQELTLPSGTRTVLYADIKAVTKRKVWPVIGHLEVRDDELALLKHGVGGTLYHGNDLVRTFNDAEDRASFPQVQVSGDAAIHAILKFVSENAGSR